MIIHFSELIYFLVHSELKKEKLYNKNADRLLGHRDIKNADNLGHRDTETVDMCGQTDTKILDIK